MAVLDSPSSSPTVAALGVGRRASVSWTADDGTTAMVLTFEPEDAGCWADVQFVSAKAVAGAGTASTYDIRIGEYSCSASDDALVRYQSASTAVGSRVEDMPTGRLRMKLDSSARLKLWVVPDTSTTDGEATVDIIVRGR